MLEGDGVGEMTVRTRVSTGLNDPVGGRKPGDRREMTARTRPVKDSAAGVIPAPLRLMIPVAR
ncbi:hypothetical protein GCM10010317_050570 [Streptomyces mirabilis]|nr:hypothetical protein GCM10010317_050570 [Streptomyces mirabilis]